MNPFPGTGNFSNSNPIESFYFNNVVSSRNLLNGIINILNEQECNMRTLIINNTVSNQNFNNSNNTNIQPQNFTNTFGVTNPTSIPPPPPPPPPPSFQRSRIYNRYNRNIPNNQTSVFSNNRNNIERPRFSRRNNNTRENARGNPQERTLSNLFTNLLNPMRNQRQNNIFEFDFFSPVNVTPTPLQIANSTRLIRFGDINEPVNRICPISQENFNTNDNVIQICHCRHNFTPEHFNTWFSRSVRCPICRHDIRSNLEPINENTTVDSSGATVDSSENHVDSSSNQIDSSGATVYSSENVVSEENNTDAEYEAFQNSIEFNINTQQSLDNMINMISNSLGLDSSSNITVQYRVLDERNNEDQETLEENTSNNSDLEDPQ